MYRNSRRVFIAAYALCLLVFASYTAFGQTWTKDLAPGVTLTQKVIASSDPEIINSVKIDPKSPGVVVRSVLSQDKIYMGTPGRGCEVVSSMSKRLNAVVTVNADFFGLGGNMPGDPLNLMVRDGELISEPSQRVVFGFTSDKRVVFDNLTFDAQIKLADGKAFPIRGINRGRKDHEVVVYSKWFCEHTCTNEKGSEAIVKLDSPMRIGKPVTGTITEVKTGAGDASTGDGLLVLSGQGTGAKFIDDNLKAGTAVTLEFTVKGQRTGVWDKVAEAVGGGSWLVRDGKEFISAKEEGFGTSFSAGRNPRTAVGLTKDGKLLLVTVDGRQSISGGMGLPALAQVMIGLGCVQAANLDGGGSTTMATSFGIINSPSSGIERMVSNGVAVLVDPVQSAGDMDFTIAPLAGPVPSGTSVQLSLLDGSGQPLASSVVGKALWSTMGGMGFVDQSGRFYGVKAKKGSIIVKLGSKTASIPIETCPGSPTELVATLKADPGGAANRGVLTVSAGDVNGNGVRQAQVSVKVTGGTADADSLTTDDRGAASTGVTWDGTAGAQVVATCGTLSDKASPPSK